jgi:hypothetical protein
MSAALSNLPARAGFLSGVRSYRPRRTLCPLRGNVECEMGNAKWGMRNSLRHGRIITAAAVVLMGAAAAACCAAGCHAVHARCARSLPIDFLTPNPDVPNSNTIKTNGLAGGPESADVREPAAGQVSETAAALKTALNL